MAAGEVALKELHRQVEAYERGSILSNTTCKGHTLSEKGANRLHPERCVGGSE